MLRVTHAATARLVEQALIDTDPTNEFHPLPLKCDATIPYFGPIRHYDCNPLTCIAAAMECMDDYYQSMDAYYN